VIGRRLALILAVALVTPLVRANDLSPPVVKLELAIRAGDSGRLDVSLNGIPVRATEQARMTCPPPPQSCAGMITVMAVATTASVVFLYALSRNR
jgi:hypothetical protein